MAEVSSRFTSPVLALLWEQWQQTRMRLLMVLAAATLLAVAWVAAEMRHPAPNHEIQVSSMFIVIFLFSLAAGILLFSYYERSDLRLSFPSRLFVLPVRVPTLVAVRMLYDLVAMGLLVGLPGCVVWFASGDVAPLRITLFWSLCGLAYIHAVSWTLGRLGLFPALLVLVGFVPPIGQALRSPWINHPHLDYLIALAFVAACYGVAVVGVSLHRKGGFKGLRARLRKKPEGQRLPARRNSRPSAKAAQAALEWRRTGSILPKLFTIVLVPMTLFFLSDSTVYSRSRGMESVVQLLSTNLLVVATLSGLFLLIVDERDRVNGFNRFLFTRPLSTRQLAAARLRAGARGVLAVFGLGLVLAAVLAAILYFPESGESIVHSHQNKPGDTMLFMALALVGYAVLTWALLMAAAPILTVFFVVMAAVNSLPASDQAPVLYGAIAVSAVALSAAFVRTVQLGLLSGRALVLILGTWLFLFVLPPLFYFYAFFEGQGSEWTLGLLAALSPLVPFAYVPLRLHHVRHH